MHQAKWCSRAREVEEKGGCSMERGTGNVAGPRLGSTQSEGADETVLSMVSYSEDSTDSHTANDWRPITMSASKRIIGAISVPHRS